MTALDPGLLMHEGELAVLTELSLACQERGWGKMAIVNLVGLCVAMNFTDVYEPRLQYRSKDCRL
ncbi:predicted protein [Sclerotinia sclerotiorum 1980 UF-70]|uniref:Uncharacterized protein n=1 Tax=Sclerotinia sclerotiorum (strain ATCC 18683 / 1980 / Ss-1) TaxID=665079 RepID=A7F522_SCLS1|nr:predicted protein [Sclerotinia sclerotiorum 1980 UF-70]EDN97843.1 predicted protein [Sclerotinia sclerotiorum 1980 UF-70]